MKRVLSLVLALVLVLGMIPTFAAEKTGGEELKALGLLSGNENGDLMEDQTLERQEFAKVIAQLNGALDEAAAYVTPGTYADFDKVEGWARNYVAYAEEQGWMTGKTGNIFDPAAELKSQELLVVLLRVLGYDDTWSKAFETAAEVGLVAEEITAITRGDAFELIWTAVSEVKMADSDMTLGVHLGVLEPVVVVTELAVADVVANNLKTMVVEFNKAVDGTSITASTVKAVKGSTDVVASRILSEDGKTLTIVYTTAAVAQSSDVKLTIDGVKSEDGSEKITGYTSTYAVTDVAIPVIKGAAALNAKQIEVFFSEPMNTEALSSVAFQVINDVKIGDVAAIAKVTPNFATNSAVFELSTVLAAKTHTVKLANLVDYAGYKALAASFDVTVVEDKAAPQITSAVVKNINTIEVTFNESLSQVGSFYLNGGSSALTANVVANSNNTKYTLTGFTLDLSAIVQVKVEYVNQKDVVGNTVSTKTAYVFNVADDTVLPTVAVAVGTSNKITLTFSKPMLTTVGTIQVLDKDKAAFGSSLNVSALTFKSGSNNTVLELTGAQVGLGSVNAGTYFVKIKDMKDATVRANLLPEQVLEIAAVDSKAPTVTSSYTVKAGTLTGADAGKDDTITFYFSEAMDQETLKNLSNFVLNPSTAFSAVSGVSFKSVAADGKSVTFTYPNANGFVAQTFTVYAVKDLAGNMATTNTTVAKLNSALATPTTVTLSASDKVQITFNNVISSVDPSFITVNDGTGAFAVPVSATIGGSGANAGKVVTFTLNKALGTATTGYTVVQNNVTLVTDIYGQSYAGATTFSITGANFVDNVSPVVDKVLLGSAANVIRVTFSEPIAAVGADTELDLVVKNITEDEVLAYTDYTATLSGGELIITLLDGGVSADKVSVQLLNGRFVADAAGKVATPFAAMTVMNGNDEAVLTDAQAQVNAVAAGIALTFAAGDGTTAVDTVVKPVVPAGYTIAVSTTSAAGVYDATGAVKADGTSNVVFTITHVASGLTANTGTVVVTVNVQ